ncbi:MAG: hypothetical protein JO054_11805 [Actinobacteria bacterium]|nr:hypothetical protein [Actinomycetota bacterium]
MPADRPARAVVRLVRKQMARSAYAWASIVYLAAYGTAKGYVATYPDLAGRQKIAALVQRNPAFQAINGIARRLETPGGYVTWRVGGVLMVVVAAWAAVATTRVLRGDEDLGRADIVRSGAVTGRQVEVATLASLTGAVGLVASSVFAGLLSARLALAGSALLSAAVCLSGLLFVAVAAVTSELFAPRRRANQVAVTFLGACFAIRVIADGTRGLGWLRWCTPLGWAEQTHPFSGDVVWPLALLATLAAGLTALALTLQRNRDVGAGALFSDRPARSRLTLLASPTQFAVRSELSAVLVWCASVGAYAVIVGLLAKDFSSFVSTSKGFKDVAARLTTTTLTSPAGFLALIFTFFAPPIALMGVFQIGAARSEEGEGHVEMVLATAITRRRWLIGRVAVGVGAVVVTALVAGLLAWTGTAIKGGGVGLGSMMRASINMLPAALLFLALAVAAFGLRPRLTVAVSAGAVAATYLLQLIGALVKAPTWVLDLSPFHHLAAVPIAPMNGTAAAVMLALAAALLAVGVVGFNRRDVAGL